MYFTVSTIVSTINDKCAFRYLPVVKFAPASCSRLYKMIQLQLLNNVHFFSLHNAITALI